jgi:hypothetical protein
LKKVQLIQRPLLEFTFIDGGIIGEMGSIQSRNASKSSRRRRRSGSDPLHAALNFGGGESNWQTSVR